MNYAASLRARSEASAHGPAPLVLHPETTSQFKLIVPITLRSTAVVAVAMAAFRAVPVAAEPDLQPYASEYDDWTFAARARIEALHSLGDNWNGQGAVKPNEAARDLAVQIVRLAPTKPERIVPVPDGGIAMYFVSPRMLPGGAPQKYARLICDNDGEIVLLQHDRQSGSSDVELVGGEDATIGDRAILEALERAQGFLA